MKLVEETLASRKALAELEVSGSQGDSISGWSFYGFSHSLDFRVKRYHWYQS